MSKNASRYRRLTSLQKLKPDFKAALIAFETRLKIAGLPFKRFETFRGEERQDHLKKRGASKASWGSSPHNFGLAADYVIDLDCFAHVREREWPKGSNRYYPDAWDTETPEAMALWVRFGEVVRAVPGIEWGGGSRLGGNPAWDRVFDDPDGDFPHVQKENWRDCLVRS